MKSTLFIQAMNVHQGGGRALLMPLLAALPADRPVTVLLDERLLLPEPLPAHVQIRRVRPKLTARLLAERWLSRTVTADDTVLCFGNLPPLARLAGHVIVFVQNRLLIDAVPLDGFGLKTRLRLRLERWWLLRCASHGKQYVVQTPSMQTLLSATLRRERAPIEVWPFAAVPEPQRAPPAAASPVDAAAGPRHDFIYPASGDPHKNHRCLVEAWVRLAEEGLFPVLCLTLDETSPLWRSIETARARHGLRIVNLGFVPHRQLLQEYARADALIYPSLLESFGLPLIEAGDAGLPIVAAELDYVRDLVEPAQTFDPHSPASIARAVRRQLGAPGRGVDLLTAPQFMERVAHGVGEVPQRALGAAR